MLKWGGDYSLPRLRAKLATTGAGTEHAEPDYAEVYRPDLGQSTILRKESPEFFAAVAENGGFEAFARSSGYRGLNKGLSRSSLWKTGSTTAPKSSQTFGQTTMSQTTQMGLNQTMLRTRSVPTLGSRTVERAPAHSQPFPPTWHVSSTSSLPGIVAAKQALTTAGPPVDDPKEKQAEVASKKLWTAIHGSEYLVQEEVAALQKEGQPNNQAFLAKLNKSDSRFPGIKKALKAGAKVDWRNPEWDGATLLIRAARTGSLELAMFCLSQSASIQERDNSGRGVLHWAALSGNNCLMQYLLTEYSLDVSSPDGLALKPLMLQELAGGTPGLTLAMSEPKGKGLSKGPRGPKGKGKAPGPPPRPPSRPPGKAPDGPKLRPLFWQTVGQVPTESVWSSLGPPVPFDTSLLERRFAMAEARAPRKAVDATGDEPKKKLRVLDDRTSQLLAISFNKLPPAEQLAQVVDTLETFPDGLAPEAVMALNSATVEQKDAVEQLKSLDVREADLMQLDVPERYLWVMANNSVCAAKIASGALIVGLAPELPELSLACQRVRDGCRRLQSSILVKRFISTCLAVGNVMNRGTARGSARAIVLPEGLLKLDELRGSGETEGVSGLSLLDFVSEAILVEASCTSGKGVQAQLRAEADELREGMRAAQGVCLHDADTSCQRICRAASHAQSGLSQHLANLSVARLAATVQSICKESEKCSAQVAEAKAQLKKSMEWASAKPNTSSSDWLGSWVQFLEQLAGAIDRVKLPELPMRPVQADCNGAASGRSVFQDVSNTPQMSHEVVRLLVHAGAKETANANGFTPLQLAEAGSSRLICSEWPICGDVRTVWDISFGTLRNPDCGGCEGFLRHVGCPAASAQIFRCVRCNCFSKDHLPVEGPQAEDPLQRLPGGGFRDSRGYGAAPAGQSRQQAAGWPGIGEMVWVPQQASVQKRAGIVVQTEASETSAFCTVELLAAHGVAEADRRQVVATECLTEWAPAWSPPRVQGDFDKEAHFKNLVFQL
ncbi:unnamed protein product [Effrenium voratum]|uniref:FH2 domain-containing protein n=1 Tax=Effrenium voratum TaxID=2562239 RepID=A0AA36HNM8_9DINO|nr:unnamed protein product [Effrenium voratum]